jgi:hypothetical protein
VSVMTSIGREIIVAYPTTFCNKFSLFMHGADSKSYRNTPALELSGVRDPLLYVPLQYARTANILVEWLIDDEIDLPSELPSVSLPTWVVPKRLAVLSRHRK